MDFHSKKQQILSRPDKSLKGSFDELMVPLCAAINSLPQFCTTSSCAGRIVLLGLDANYKKHVSLSHFNCHTVVSVDAIAKALHSYNGKEPLWLRSEPFIIHVDCRDLSDAEQLLALANKLGLKRSGITSLGRIITIEITSTEKMDVPVVIDGKILPSNEYLQIIVREANNKLVRTQNKLEACKKLFMQTFGLQ